MLKHWSYVSFGLNHWYMKIIMTLHFHLHISTYPPFNEGDRNVYTTSTKYEYEIFKCNKFNMCSVMFFVMHVLWGKYKYTVTNFARVTKMARLCLIQKLRTKLYYLVRYGPEACINWYRNRKSCFVFICNLHLPRKYGTDMTDMPCLTQ